jgi:hypothetical protein
VTVALLVALAYARRIADGVSNVDDYLYAAQTSDLLHGLSAGPSGVVEAWKQHPTNSPLVPTLATPLAAIDPDPSTLVLIQLPLMLGLLGACALLLGRLGVRGRCRWVLAAAVVVLPPVLTYSVMLSFAIAAALCTVAALASYLASDRLRRIGPAIGLGAALGLLSLTRVVAVVYLAALAVPIAVDLAVDRTDVQRRCRGGLLALAIALALALPWWLTAGPDAWHYLTDAGYSDGSVFTRGWTLPHRLTSRLTWTADESGWLIALTTAAVFVVATATAVARLVRHRGAHDESEGNPDRAVVLSAAVVVLGMLLLGTSSNAGTAFALPMFVMAACAGVAVATSALRDADRRRRFGAVVAGGVLLFVTVGAVFLSGPPPAISGRRLWLSETPVRSQVEAAMGCDCALPDQARLNEDIYAVIGGQRTLVLRDDAVVNPESLRFVGRRQGVQVDLLAPGGGALRDRTLLRTVRYVLAGKTAAPYLTVDLARADQLLDRAGFRVVLERSLSPSNRVVVYAAPGTAP